MPAGAPAEQAQVMIDACSQAVRSGGCALSSASPESTRPETVAIVLWQGDDFLHVRIRVSRGDGEWASRQIDFSTADAPSDRWTAVGLTVATLVDETRERPTATPPPAAATSTPAPSPPPTQQPAPLEEDHGPPRFAVSAGGLTGTGWDDGGWQRGVWISAAAAWPRTPLFGIVGTSYAWSDGPTLAGAGTLDTRWYDMSLGLGLATTLRPLNLRVFVAPELTLQLISASLSATDEGLRDREARLRLRSGLVWPARGRFGATLGGTMRLLPIGSDDATPNRARTSRIAAGLFGGIELRL